MVSAEAEALRHAPASRPRRSMASAGFVVAALASGVLLAAVLLTQNSGAESSGPVVLDQTANEIKKLQSEKAQLESQLTVQRKPLLHPDKLKAAVKHTAQLKTGKAIENGKQTLLHQSVPPKKHVVKSLKSEKAELEATLAHYSSEKDPLVQGVMGRFNKDSLKTIEGRLGQVQENKENVLGSLAVALTPSEQMKMLRNEATSVGDVSPKEAFARRIISIGNQILKKGNGHAEVARVMHQAPKEPAQVHARVASHQRLLAKKAKAVQMHKVAKKSHAPVQPVVHETSVRGAKHRIEVLKKELVQAKKVAELEKSLAQAKHALKSTEQKAGTFAPQKLVANIKEGTRGRYDRTREALKKFVGVKDKEEDKEEDEKEDEEDCRFKGTCHGEGYIKGAIVVGTPEHSGPDRYSQSGAGPQVIKGRLGDNMVGVGVFGSAGNRDDDVLVPTALSGVRRRDTFITEDPKENRILSLPKDVSDEIVKGSVVHHFGRPGSLGIADREVPFEKAYVEEVYKQKGAPRSWPTRYL